jgi:hypothetical protein
LPSITRDCSAILPMLSTRVVTCILTGLRGARSAAAGKSGMANALGGCTVAFCVALRARSC